MTYILYHNNSSMTGKELKRVLGIDGGTDGPGSRPDKIIRWGNRADLRFNASGGVLNRKDACSNASNKQRALELMAAAHVNVPPAVDRFDGELLIGRTETHMQGRGAFMITSQRDFELAKNNLGCSHFMRYIPTDREYRIHVFKNEVIAMSEKRMTDHCTSLHIRNFKMGWVFHYLDGVAPEIVNLAKSAVSCLGLDFGACDIIKSVNGNLYVLEVNTAPSLVKEVTGGAGAISIEHMPAFQKYVGKFVDWISER